MSFKVRFHNREKKQNDTYGLFGLYFNTTFPKQELKIMSSNEYSSPVKFCPACGQAFRKFPLGWDSHAAHTCSGLRARMPETRKAEYKKNFGCLFKGA